MELQDCQIARDKLPFPAPRPKPWHHIPGVPSRLCGYSGPGRELCPAQPRCRVPSLRVPQERNKASCQEPAWFPATAPGGRPSTGAAPGQSRSAAGRDSHSPRGVPAEQAAGRAPRASPGCTSQQAAGVPTLLKLPLLAASIRRSSAKKGDGLGSEKPSCNPVYLTREPRVRHWRLSSQLELLQVLTPWSDWFYMAPPPSGM